MISASVPRVLWTPAVVFGAVLLGAVPQSLGARQDEPFTSEEQVTAIDLVVELDTGGLRNWASGGSPLRDLKAQEFEILYDGEPRPVVGLGDPGEPWSLVVYFDYALSSVAGVRRAASALAEQAGELTRLGNVEVIVADPVPGEVLAPTRDAELVASVLSEIALFPAGRNELVALRRAFLEEIRNQSAAVDRTELAQALVGEEVRIVRRQLDALLIELVDGVDADARRALLLVSGGFDPEPAEFYRPYFAPSAEQQAPAADLGADVEVLGRTLAAYGWITLALAPPEPKPMPRGLRLGKWRILGLGAVYEENRDPEKAESYLELGRTLAQQGKLEKAEEAFRKAVYHFYDSPKTASRQAEALVHLGGTLERQGKSGEAQEAFEEAVRIDPGRAAVHGPGGALRDPRRPLRSFAQITVGTFVQDREALAAAVAGLSRRVHLIYQVAGLPDGRLHALEVRFRRGATVTAPGWSRSSIPEAVAKARLRILLEGELPGGELGVRGDLRPASGSRAGEMAARIAVSRPDPPFDGLRSDNGPRTASRQRLRRTAASEKPLAEDGGTALLRVTLGLGDPSSAVTFRHQVLEPQKLAAGEEWIYRTRIVLPEDQPWVAVLVEDLNSGRWGTGLLESFDSTGDP
ncbi:MAG: tetratricopeptide repeat protein [bacterium]|nr:tetratricopeptide repeat protein [bacterium]